MIKSNFSDWTLDKMDEAFGLQQIRQHSILNEVLSFKHECDDYEKRYLTQLQELYLYLGGDDWNEVELENKFISPLITFAQIDNEKFAYFLERTLAATVGEYELSGIVDGLIATGYRNPRKPYFCLAEYKHGTDPNGDPKGQMLIAMLVAQQLNDNKSPTLGCFIIGKAWQFAILVDKQYAISNTYICTNEDIFEIFSILKGIRVFIEKQIIKSN